MCQHKVHDGPAIPRCYDSARRLNACPEASIISAEKEMDTISIMEKHGKTILVEAKLTRPLLLFLCMSRTVPMALIGASHALPIDSWLIPSEKGFGLRSLTQNWPEMDVLASSAGSPRF